MERSLRFGSKHERQLKPIAMWLMVLNAVAATVRLLLAPHPGRVVALLSLATCLAWGIAVWTGRPRGCELGPAGIHLLKGLSERIVPYEDVVSILPGTLEESQDRLVILTNTGERFSVTIADHERFFDEVLKRFAELERRGYGLLIPGATQSESL